MIVINAQRHDKEKEDVIDDDKAVDSAFLLSQFVFQTAKIQ